MKRGMKVIDIFAGPGGLGEGFSAYEENGKRPFNLSLSIEKDAAAHSTLLMRSFYRQFQEDNIPEDYWDYCKSTAGAVRPYERLLQRAKPQKDKLGNTRRE